MTDLEPAGLVVNSVSYAYNGKLALDNVSFTVPNSTFCGLLGPNGAGKTTLLSLLTHLFVARQGKICIEGIDLAVDYRLALAKVGVVFQQQTLDLDMTVFQNLRYFAALHGMAGKTASKAIDESLGRLDMAERAQERVRELNGGHRRRTEIARALIHKPRVLMLDEPTVGLDAASRASIVAYVHRLSAEEGLSVLWATHLVDEILDQDALVVLHRGKVLAKGSVSEIAGESTVADRFLELTKDAAA